MAEHKYNRQYSPLANYDQKTAAMDPEERALREENLAMRPYYDISGIRALYAAVALKAIKDYTFYVARGTPSHREARICEAFFNSDAFGALYDGLDARDIRKKVERRIEKVGKGVPIRNYYRTPTLPRKPEKKEA